MTIDLITPEEQERILLSAICNGDLDEVKHLVGVKGYRGVGIPLRQSAFNTAVGSGNVEMAKYLKSRGHGDDGCAVENAIRSKSLPMFSYITEDLSLRFESRHFELALGFEWPPGQYDELLRAILDKADCCGYFDFSAALLGLSDGTGDDIDGLLSSIRHFLGKMAGEKMFFYALDIIDDNYSGEILFRNYDGVDYSLLNSVVETGDLKSFKAIWDRVHHLAFYSAEKSNIDSFDGLRELLNRLFELATDKGHKEILDYLANFAEPDY